MLDSGLLEVVAVEVEPGVPDPDAFLDLPAPEHLPEIVPLSTALLWPLWRGGAILQSADASHDERPRPRWDAPNRSLFLGPRQLKWYGGHPAPNQIRVLEAFEDAGWPPSITNPLRVDQLADTIKALEKSLGDGSPIHFFANGSGQEIAWAYKS